MTLCATGLVWEPKLGAVETWLGGMQIYDNSANPDVGWMVGPKPLARAQARTGKAIENAITKDKIIRFTHDLLLTLQADVARWGGRGEVTGRQEASLGNGDANVLLKHKHKQNPSNSRSTGNNTHRSNISNYDSQDTNRLNNGNRNSVAGASNWGNTTRKQKISYHFSKNNWSIKIIEIVFPAMLLI